LGVSDDEAFAVGVACGGRTRVGLDRVGRARPEAMLADLVAARAARRLVAYVVNTATGERRIDGPEPWADRFRADRSGMEEDGATFVHVHNPPLRMIVVGAVHIAQALLPMARMAGYDVSLIDPRPAFAQETRFPGEAVIEDWPDEAMDALKPDARTAVVTLTHDPKLDDPAISRALGSEIFYLGCLGSTRTHAKRVARLTGAGFTGEQIARIHAPVGLDIGARGPAEIAVSILAEVTKRLRQG
jgi:xanthine dehydrogenase accessory factor